jgi:hypothetical protein
MSLNIYSKIEKHSLAAPSPATAPIPSDNRAEAPELFHFGNLPKLA